MTPQDMSKSLRFRPLTEENWLDFEHLFGEKGACSGCWCMWWRITRAEFNRQSGEGNRQAMKRIVASGEVPGILAYLDGTAVGWCSVAPREAFASLNRSPVLRRLDDTPVWSIVCFFVDKAYRSQGVAGALVRAAIDHVASQGGKVVEAYPSVPQGKRLAAASGYMGVPRLFERAGFVECARPSTSKMIVRHYIR